MTFKPEVVTNRTGETVAQALSSYWQGLLDQLREPPHLAISTAYFNPGGFSLLAEQLERAGHVRLLLGAEPDVATDLGRLRPLRKGRLPEDDPDIRLSEALKEHHRLMEEDRNLIAFSREADSRIQRMLEWLRSEDVEVKLLRERFLHGKAFIVETGRDGVLAGSSNFTFAGLSRNVELNLGQYQPGVVGEVVDWYEEQWEAAEDYDLAGIYERRFAEYSPYVVYLKMLWERYRDELDREEPPPGLELTAFQRDGLYRAMDYLGRNNGVLIADGVGLGKTYLAGELIRQAYEDRRQRVLLIAPAALRDGPWKKFLDDYFLGGVEVVSFQQLAGEPALGGNGSRVLRQDPDDYAMVVIDEAHAYRNPETSRAATLRQLLTGSPPKKVVLLTATPVNNSLWDLYHLISYFVRNDAVFLDSGIPSLRKHFAEAEAEDPEDLSPDKLFDVLDAVAVRRTRRFVKRFYPNERIRVGDKEVTITFPQPEVLRETYELEALLPDFFERFAYALGADVEAEDSPLPTPDAFEYGEQLTLARYAPSAYRLGDLEAETFELQAAGLLRSGLLKRFESSVYAFARTCHKMAASHESFLAALDEGWVLTGGALAAWNRTDSDEFDVEALEGGRHDQAANYDVGSLREAVEADRMLLIGFAEEAERVGNDKDPKLDALVEALAKIVERAKKDAISSEDERDKRKVIVFSYYADTVEWVYERLAKACDVDPRLAPYRSRIATVTGSSGGTEDVLFGFAPISSQAPRSYEDSYDLLVATDVLAEGVNLQQARHIINFDLPWNPMRLVQRHGRIDRIGSPHSHVYLRCFFPSQDLDALLGLEDALQRKIAQAAKSIGVEGEIVPGSKASDQVFAHTLEQIEALRQEDATLFEQAEDTGTLSGEEFRSELAEALDHPRWKNEIKQLPWVAGSGKTTEGAGGFIFCVRVGDHPRPQYRWVPLASGGEQLEVDAMADDTLTCLGKAACTPTTERVLPEHIADLAYDAWEVARRDIYERWIESTDPANMQPAIPKPMREAAELLSSHPPKDLETDRLYRLLDTIEAPYDTRTQRMMRKTLDQHQDTRERVEAVIQLVEDLGLEPPPPIDPLPEVEEQDINLVTWLALVPNVYR